MNDIDRETEALLERHFAAARAATPEPPAGLSERVRADAAALNSAPASRRARAPGPLLEIWRTLGGWPAAAGLSAAALAGVWIGVAAPRALDGGLAALAGGGAAMPGPAAGFELALEEL